MESPLSFNSSENFRKKLLVRNLKPYKVDGSFTSNDTNIVKEYQIVDYSVIDSESIEIIGNKQEIILYPKNKYGPTNTNSTYGNIVNINLNLNTESNQGTYGYDKTIDSKLEQIGNQREIFSKIKNVYKSSGDDYGIPVYTINNDNIILTNGTGIYDISDTFGSYLEQIGNQQEVTLRVKNKYTPEGGNDYGNTRYSINDILSIGSNEGSYTFVDSVGSNLEVKGLEKRNETFPSNQYGPTNGQSLFVVEPFINQQTNAPEGNYGFDDTFNSPLEIIGNQQEIVLRVKNKYTPEGGTDYGQTRYSINDLLPIGSNEGEYNFADTVGSKLETDGSLFRNQLFPISQYGPEGEQSQNTVNPNVNQQTFSNEGNYDYNDTLGSPLEVFAENSLNFQINQYGPQSQPGNAADENINIQTKPFEGEYDFSDTVGSELEIIGKIESNDAYVINKYVTGDGDYDTITIDDIQTQTTGQRYYNSSQSFSFLPSDYLPINILLSNNPNGSNGSLSQDSDLAKIAAKRLQKEFKYRVAAELLSETLGRLNVVNSSIDPDSGEISVKPKLDPFNALGILSGNVPLIQRNYKITDSNNIIGKAIGFVANLTGLYSPYSLIPGEYFDYPKKRLLNRLIDNPFEPLTTGVMGAITKITSPPNQTGSERFVAFTSNATQSLIFNQISLNEFRPKYTAGFVDSAVNTLTGVNLSAPDGSFYIGSRKNTITEIVSPVNALPVYKDGEPFNMAVYSYGEVAKEYEGEKINDYFFGLNTRPLYDGKSQITGDFSWTTKKSFFKPGRKVGPGGKQEYKQNEVFDANIKRAFEDSVSYSLDFKEGSILDVTQKIVDAGSKNGVYYLKHVGNAINQVSKVFNDGYIEITKGSRVIKYKTKNSVESTSKNFEGLEYCRLFTKDNPYYTYSQLQKTDGNIRKSTYSIFDNTYNLNIAPMNDKNGQSTNIQEGKVKKYMFSLENLAWRTSNKKGFTVDDLPSCEKGPNGGRIMWFPPYDLTFNESVKPDFDSINFLGRPEPIYTYKNTSRTGSLSWSIIVDHPSISNLLIEKELENVTPDSEITKIMDSFFAGCLKYDLYELAKKFVQFTPNDIQEAISLVKNKEDAKKVATETSPEPEAIVETQDGLTDDEKEKFKEIYLFFENALPDDSDTTTTSKNYKQWYDVYTKQSIKDLYTGNNSLIKDKIFNYPLKTNVTPKILDNSTQDFDYKSYIDTRKTAISSFYNDRIVTAINILDEFKNKIAKVLDSGGKVSFSLLGTASSVSGVDYNKRLSSRRIDSVKQYILDFEYNGKKLKTYLDKTLIIKEDPQGDRAENITDESLKDINCSEPFKTVVNGVTVGQNSYEGTFSVQAMACRRTKITDLLVEPVPKPKESEPTSDGQLTETEQKDNQTITPPNIGSSPTDIQETPVYQGLAKKLIRNLLSECDYFEMLNDQQPMVYDGIKSKFKNFHPIFHSITPEGLNSRLTFLQQCMRPGDTIPTVTQSDTGTLSLNYQDAFNSAFGSPPVLVLRVGDFYHTKIIPTNLTIKFDKGALFDINPEGIGVQPMVASIDLSFNFIGGQGIAAPVAKLQNALSFNYYANTELYDERAEVTDEDLTKKYDAEFYEAAKLNTKNKKDEKPQNELGKTIGEIKTSTTDPSGSTTGTISYEKNMKTLIEVTSSYVNNVTNTLKTISDSYGLGGLYITNTDRKYQEGNVYTTDVKIYGKSENFQNKISSLFSTFKDDIENEITPLLADLGLENFKNNQKRKIKRQLKKMANDRKTIYLNFIDEQNNKIVVEELNFMKQVDQLNFVSDAKDGFINSRGRTIVYDVSGTADVDPSSSGYPNTLQELRGDYLIVADDINNFITNLETEKIISTTEDEKWVDTFDFNLYIGENQTSQDNRLNMVFGTEIVNNIDGFVNEIVEPINNNEDKTKWIIYLRKNLGNQTTGAISANGIFNNYKKQKEIIVKRFEDFNVNYFGDRYRQYRPYSDTKKRICDFVSQIPVNDTDSEKLQKIASKTNTEGDRFNLKNKGFN